MAIRISAAAIMREDGATLLVRKRGTTAFMQPGGKIEADETPLTALRRELFEELGISSDSDEFHYIGRFSAPAANEPGHEVIAELFTLEHAGAIKAQAEIAETLWLLPDQQADVDLAPLTGDAVLPAIWKTGL